MRIFRQSAGRTGCEFAKLSNPVIPAKAGIHCTSQFTQAMPGIYMTYVHPSTGSGRAVLPLLSKKVFQISRGAPKIRDASTFLR
jgi:hypothetical protein